MTCFDRAVDMGYQGDVLRPIIESRENSLLFYDCVFFIDDIHFFFPYMEIFQCADASSSWLMTKQPMKI